MAGKPRELRNFQYRKIAKARLMDGVVRIFSLMKNGVAENLQCGVHSGARLEQ